MNRALMTASVFVFLFISACQSQNPAGTSRTNPAPAQDASGQGEVKPTSLLTETGDKYFALQWLTAENVDQYAAEINRLGITHIQIDGIDASRRDSQVLRVLYSSCSGLTAIAIRNSTFSTDELRELLSSLPKLKELRLSSCRLTINETRNIGGAKWMSLKLGLTNLSISHCHGVDNDTVASLLARMSALEELHLADDANGTGEIFDGEGWPLDKLTRLKKFSLSSPATDALIRRVLAELPNLTSLKLWRCEGVKGIDWSRDELGKIEELSFIRCENISANALSAILKHTPHLKSLQVHDDKDSDEGTLDLTPLIELRDLSVRGKSSKLQGFESLINLQSLSMLYATLVDGAGFDFSPHAKLKSLAIDGCASGRLETLPPSIETLHIHGCGVSNTSVGALLQRLINLRSLRLTSIYGGYGYPSDPEAITGAGWDFTNQKNLQLLDLGDCDYIQNSLVARIAEQLPRLESLRFADSPLLTGDGWDLQRLSNLKQLELNELPQVENETIHQLPKSLESLKISGCLKMTGRSWDLASLPSLTNLEIQRCGSLTSIGTRLPPSLETLAVRECVRFQGRELSYSWIEKLERVSFSECHEFDVDRLFAALPKHAASLRRLNLTGCPNPAPRGWDLSPLKETLRELIYPEGEPSYVGGISEANYRMLQQQLPNTKIIR